MYFMKKLEVISLCSMIFVVSLGCKKDECTIFEDGGCYRKDLIEDFFITSVDGLLINPLEGEIEIDCTPHMQDGASCRIDITGSSDGIRTQQCKFIYVFVKATLAEGWHRQEITTSLRNGGDWGTNIQLGDGDFYLPFGQAFEVVAVVTGHELSDEEQITNLETYLPLDHKKTDYVRIEVK